MRDRTSEPEECAKAASAIGDMGDGLLGRGRLLLLRRHVSACAECGTYLERMRAVMETLASMDRVPAPDEFADMVMLKLLPGLTGLVREGEESTRGRRNLLWVIAAGVGVAAAVTLAVVRWALGRDHEEKLAAVSSA
jgi:anti-sigma factor RsiW